jgi:hypothetical protein
MMFFILRWWSPYAQHRLDAVMAVKDKQPDIAILRTLGARPGSVLALPPGHRDRPARHARGRGAGVLLSLNPKRWCTGCAIA